MKLKVLLSVLLSALLNSSTAQDTCSPCSCTKTNADCSKNTTQRTITNIPKLGIDVEELSIEGQFLDSIYNYSFPNIPKVKIIVLQNCRLSFVHRYSFKYMSQLIHIDLSYNNIESLDRKIFAYNEKVTTIHLNNNKIHIIKPGTFVYQKLLTYLYLQDNLLPDLSKEAFSAYTALKLLNLTNNKLRYMDGNIIEASEGLNEVYLDKNPFICDCNLKPFYLALKARKLTGINSECAAPKRLEFEPLIDLSANDFTCSINVSSTMNSSDILTNYNKISLLCLVQANAEPYVSWKFNNSMIYFDSNTKYQLHRIEVNTTVFIYNLTINNLTQDDDGYYICNAKNTGFMNETRYKLTVVPAVEPKILIPNEEYIVVDLHEENYTIPFKIFGIPKPVVTWRYREKLLSSESNNVNKSVTCKESTDEPNTYWFNITIRKVKLKYRTEFTCNASNFKGSTNKTITLKILYPKKVTFEETSNYIQTKELQNTTLICGVNAVPKPNIIWRYGSHFKLDAAVSPNKYDIRILRDSSGTYWSRLTIFQIDLYEGGMYKCEANNSEIVEVQNFTVVVNKVEKIKCDDNTWRTTLLIAIGCTLLVILLIIIILKCCIRYHVSKNHTQEYSYRGSILR